MTQHHSGRPAETEYAPYYAGYVNQVSESDILTTLHDQLLECCAHWRGIDPAATTIVHPPYQWTLRQVLGHICDGERVFGYRALRFSRGDETELPGFDEKLFVQNTDFNRYPWLDLVAEFEALRQANYLLFKNLAPEAWPRSGIASDNSVSVRALAYILVGHVRHHATIIEARLAGAHPALAR
jgi:hypothetical protein